MASGTPAEVTHQHTFSQLPPCQPFDVDPRFLRPREPCSRGCPCQCSWDCRATARRTTPASVRQPRCLDSTHLQYFKCISRGLMVSPPHTITRVCVLLHLCFRLQRHTVRLVLNEFHGFFLHLQHHRRQTKQEQMLNAEPCAHTARVCPCGRDSRCRWLLLSTRLRGSHCIVPPDALTWSCYTQTLIFRRRHRPGDCTRCGGPPDSSKW